MGRSRSRFRPTWRAVCLVWVAPRQREARISRQRSELRRFVNMGECGHGGMRTDGNKSHARRVPHPERFRGNTCKIRIFLVLERQFQNRLQPTSGEDSTASRFCPTWRVVYSVRVAPFTKKGSVPAIAIQDKGHGANERAGCVRPV